MNPITIVILSFLMVAGITFLAGMALLRLWPAVQRDRLKGAPAPAGGATSILRWTGDPETGWKRTAERIGRAVAGSPEGRWVDTVWPALTTSSRPGSRA